MANYKEFTWESTDHSPRGFIHRHRKKLPLIVKVTQGYCGIDDDDEYNYPAEEIYRIKEIKEQTRAIFTDHTDQLFSIPVTYPAHFQIMYPFGKMGMLQSLITLQHELKVDTKVVMENDARRIFYVGANDGNTQENKLQFGTLKFVSFQTETYLVGNCIVEGVSPIAEWPTIIIPHYVDTRLALASGLKGGTREEFDKEKSFIAKICANNKSKDVQGNREIMLLDGDPDELEDYENVIPKQYVRTEQKNPHLELAKKTCTCKTPPVATPRTISNVTNQSQPVSQLENTRNDVTFKQNQVQPTNNSSSNVTNKMPPVPPPRTFNYYGTNKTPPKNASDNNIYKKPPMPEPRNISHEDKYKIPPVLAENKNRTDDGTLQRGRLPTTPPDTLTLPPSQPLTGDPSDDDDAADDNDDYEDPDGLKLSKHVPQTTQNTKSQTPSPSSPNPKYINGKTIKTGVCKPLVVDNMHKELAGVKTWADTRSSPVLSHPSTGTLPATRVVPLKLVPPQMPDTSVNLDTDDVYVLAGDVKKFEQTRTSNLDVYKSLSEIPSDVSHLTVDEVADCLELLKLEKHVTRFDDEQIDGSLLCELNKDILLNEFHFTGFEATKLMKFVNNGWRPK